MSAGFVRWDVPLKVQRAASRVPTRHDRELVEQALTRYVAEMSRAEIALELTVHPWTVSLWVRKSGLTRTGKRPKRITETEIQETVDAYRQFGSIRAAARALGKPSENSVRLILHRHAPDVLAATEAGEHIKAGDPQLPVEPLAQLLDERVKQGVLISRLAESAGVGERRVNAIRNREYSTVRLSTADALCLAAGYPLSLVYPPDLEMAAAA